MSLESHEDKLICPICNNQNESNFELIDTTYDYVIWKCEDCLCEISVANKSGYDRDDWEEDYMLFI
jgi:uncharacterized Zn finger protein